MIAPINGQRPPRQSARFGFQDFFKGAFGSAFLLAAFVWVFVLPICGLIYLFTK